MISIAETLSFFYNWNLISFKRKYFWLLFIKLLLLVNLES